MKKLIEIVGKSWENVFFKNPFAFFGKKKACFPTDLLVKQAKKSSGDWIRTNDLRVISFTRKSPYNFPIMHHSHQR